jgi:hypothetical protein
MNDIHVCRPISADTFHVQQRGYSYFTRLAEGGQSNDPDVGNNGEPCVTFGIGTFSEIPTTAGSGARETDRPIEERPRWMHIKNKSDGVRLHHTMHA